MDYTKKIDKIEAHLQKHPADAQSQVSLLVTRSNQIEHERRQRQIAKLQEIAYYRRLRNAKRNEQ